MKEFLYNNKYKFYNIQTGEVYVTDNLKKFSQEFDVDYASLTKLVKGKSCRVGSFVFCPEGVSDERGRVYLGV